MRLFELSDDRSVTHVRRAYWSDPEDHIELPPLSSDGTTRGPWFHLNAYDVETNARKRTPILFIQMLDDDNVDWEIYVVPASPPLPSTES